MGSDKITIAFLDVGQGDSTVLILPDNSSAIVVDCPSKRKTLDYLEQKRITNLYLFMTHTDLDHIGGIVSLARNFQQIKLLAFNMDTFLIANDKSKRQIILKHLGQLIDRNEIQTESPQAGSYWNFQGVKVEVLHPADRDIKRTVPNGDTNNASAVLRVTFAKQRILLAADLEGRGWQWIIERGTDLKADILKFPHHGGWYNAKDRQPTLEKILEQINPNLVVLSVGTGNNYGHPNLDTFKLLRSRSQLRFLCTEATDQCHNALKMLSNKTVPCAGTVEVTIEENGISVIPDQLQHLAIVQSFDNAQCLVKA